MRRTCSGAPHAATGRAAREHRLLPPQRGARVSTTRGSEEARRSGRLSEQAYEHIRRGILTGDYPIGSVVLDGQIAQDLGMSKTPVRQALRLLHQEGLLEPGRRRQLVVRGLTPEQRE